MISLRTKLAISYGGILIILLVVGGLGIRALNDYSLTLQRVFRENYQSVVYCQNMREAVQHIDRALEGGAWERTEEASSAIRDQFAKFAQNLEAQQANITVHGEADLTTKLAGQWTAFQEGVDDLLTTTASAEACRRSVRDSLLPASSAVDATARTISEINLRNMGLQDDASQRRAATLVNTLAGLIACGTLVSLLFLAAMARSILGPIARLTRSVREVERGNLELVLHASARDELGELAEAFNRMAAALRELRRSDRAQLLRTQRSTLLALNSLTDAVAIVAPDGTVEVANETARTRFGLEPGHRIDNSAAAATVGPLFAQACSEVRPVKPTGDDGLIQIFAGGDEQFFLPRVIPVLDEGHQLLGATLILQDVTMLRQLDEGKRDIVSTVSHELKTPLTSVRLAIHVLLSEKLGPLEPRQAEILGAAREDADRLHQILASLLDISRMEAGREKLRRVPITPGQLVLELVREHSDEFADRGVGLSEDIPADLPKVMVDVGRIGVVLNNLLSNALRHTAAGGEVRITADRTGGDDTVRFCVRDTGSGIPPEHLAHVFEKFYRGPGQEAHTGAGLGLAIAREIIAAHGGTISAESEPGKGTSIVFSLPTEGAN